jgi:serine/threonine protein kinase
MSLREVPNSEITGRLVLRVAAQLIGCLQRLHGVGFVHKSIKPENIMIDMDHERVHLIDYGRAASFVDKNHEHLPVRMGRRLCGAFQSEDARRGCYSRKDDVIALGNVLLWMVHKLAVPCDHTEAAINAFVTRARLLDFFSQPAYGDEFHAFRSAYFRRYGCVRVGLRIGDGHVTARVHTSFNDWFVLWREEREEREEM